MSDILDQAEIDALLDAVSEGDLDHPVVDPHIFSRGRCELEAVDIHDYDFRRPELRISPDRLRAIQAMHEGFARALGASLSSLLRSSVEVRLVGAEQMTYATLVAGLPNPTCFSLLESDTLRGSLGLEISPLIIYPLIDRLLGGSNHDLFIPQRPVTLIERRLIQTILERAMPPLSEAWSRLGPVAFRLGEMEANPQLVQMVPPDAPVVVIGFELKMSGRSGTMCLCIPYSSIEPHVEHLTPHRWMPAEPAPEMPGREAGLDEQLGDAALEFSAVLAETSMTVRRLQQLEVGDVIQTDRRADAPIVLEADRQPKFLAEVGQRRGMRAARILRPWPGPDARGRFRIAGSR